MTSQTNPFLEFAKRHSDPISTSFSAGAALSRMENLLDDMNTFKIMFDEAEKAPERPWLPWFGLEIVSYYPVGFVTCLEWQARSRLTDFFNFCPDAIKADDLKGQINDRLLAQMVATNVSAANMLGSLTSIGSSAKYTSVFKRIFQGLAIEVDAHELLKPIIYEEIGDHTVDKLQSLFDYRHRLIHEIGLGLIGHFNIRDNLTIDQAIEYGEMALKTFKAIESCLTDKAPKHFPNRLTVDGLHHDEISELDLEIRTMEDVIALSIEKFRADNGCSKPNTDDWIKATKASQKGIKIEDEFISTADFLHNRYLDIRTPMKLHLRRSRLALLRQIKAELPLPDED